MSLLFCPKTRPKNRIKFNGIFEGAFNLLKSLKNLVEKFTINNVYIDKSYTPDEIDLDIKIEYYIVAFF